jgi:hypothetical protein
VYMKDVHGSTCDVLSERTLGDVLGGTRQRPPAGASASPTAKVDGLVCTLASTLFGNECFFLRCKADGSRTGHTGTHVRLPQMIAFLLEMQWIYRKGWVMGGEQREIKWRPPDRLP